MSIKDIAKKERARISRAKTTHRPILEAKSDKEVIDLYLDGCTYDEIIQKTNLSMNKVTMAVRIYRRMMRMMNEFNLAHQSDEIT